MTNQGRTFSGLDAGDAELIAICSVVGLIEKEVDSGTIGNLLAALANLEMVAQIRLSGVPLDHDDGEHGVNNHRRLAALRARVNRRLELLASERG
jgi:hypothetical protein